MATSTNDLVLITGATGHLGFKTLIDALQAGYRVRAAVRSQAKADVITSNPDFKALNVSSDRLEFVLVADLATPGAYDEAVKGVKYIIHIASPITTGNKVTEDKYQEYFIEPAVNGTLGMLRSAKLAPSVKRIVITSSVVAIAEFAAFTSGEGGIITAESRVATPTGPFGGEFAAYSASKVAALNEAEAWIKAESPSFDVVHIHPSFIEGRDALVTAPENAFAGTNGVILSVAVNGQPSSTLPGHTVHNDDVARLHVESLDQSRIPAGSYIASSNTPSTPFAGTSWESINEIVAKNFPKQVESGVLKNAGTQTSVKSKFDIAKSEEVFGLKFQGFEAQVVSVVQMYLDTLERK